MSKTQKTEHRYEIRNLDGTPVVGAVAFNTDEKWVEVAVGSTPEVAPVVTKKGKHRKYFPPAPSPANGDIIRSFRSFDVYDLHLGVIVHEVRR